MDDVGEIYSFMQMVYVYTNVLKGWFLMIYKVVKRQFGVNMYDYHLKK